MCYAFPIYKKQNNATNKKTDLAFKKCIAFISRESGQIKQRGNLIVLEKADYYSNKKHQMSQTSNLKYQMTTLNAKWIELAVNILEKRRSNQIKLKMIGW